MLRLAAVLPLLLPIVVSMFFDASFRLLTVCAGVFVGVGVTEQPNLDCVCMCRPCLVGRSVELLSNAHNMFGLCLGFLSYC